MATTRQRRIAKTDEGQRVLEAIVRGDLDEDLSLIVHNAQRRLQFATRKAFAIGARVKVGALREKMSRYSGQEGEVVKVNPKSVVVFLDSDKELFESSRKWDKETPDLALKRECASIAVSPALLTVVEDPVIARGREAAEKLRQMGLGSGLGTTEPMMHAPAKRRS